MLHEFKYKKFLKHNPYPRKLKSFDFSEDSPLICVDHIGRKIINFASNDYLGLSHHPQLIQSSQNYAKKFGVGSSASRLVTGNLNVYELLETKLANALNKPAALILGAGYQANITILEALFDKKTLGETPLVFCDRLIHASMVNAASYNAMIHRFKHNDLNHLKILLDKYANTKQTKFILVESIYSMDGDEADLKRLIELAAHYQAILYVDDAHAVGMSGLNGWGNASHYSNDIPFIMGTFSKALGSFGAYIACSEVMREYLINKCKGLIYSTALSPAILGAIAATIDLIPSLTIERERVKRYASKLRQALKNLGLDYGSSTSHIVPWIVGDDKKTHSVAQHLYDEGILIMAIVPPTVPQGVSRLRFCLTAGHSEEDVDFLIYSIAKVAARM